MGDTSGPGSEAGGPPARAIRGGSPQSVLSEVRLTGFVKVALLLLAIGALVFVGVRSRTSRRLPIERTQEVFASDGDPLKFLLPERALAECGRVAVRWNRYDSEFLPLEDNGSVLYAGRELQTGHPLRAPPSSL